MTPSEQLAALLAQLDADGFGSELTYSLREIVAKIGELLDAAAKPADAKPDDQTAQ